jgi:hypothetical protein
MSQRLPALLMERLFGGRGRTRRGETLLEKLAQSRHILREKRVEFYHIENIKVQILQVSSI